MVSPNPKPRIVSGLRFRFPLLVAAFSLMRNFARTGRTRERIHVEQDGINPAQRLTDEKGQCIAGIRDLLATLSRIPAVQRQDYSQYNTVSSHLHGSVPHVANTGLVTKTGAESACGLPASATSSRLWEPGSRACGSAPWPWAEACRRKTQNMVKRSSWSIYP